MEINFAQMGKKLWLEKIQDFYHETKVDFPTQIPLEKAFRNIYTKYRILLKILFKNDEI